MTVLLVATISGCNHINHACVRILPCQGSKDGHGSPTYVAGEMHVANTSVSFEYAIVTV